MDGVRVLRDSSDGEMVASFLLGELTSERFGDDVRQALATAGLSDRLLIEADLNDPAANRIRADLLGATRGYRQHRDVFDETFPTTVRWIRTELEPIELAKVRFISDAYWAELSAGSRLPSDAADRIRAGIDAFGVPNDRFLSAAQTLPARRFPPLILVGRQLSDLVCLEGNLRLTAHALAGFPTSAECLVGTAPDMNRWCH